MAENKITPLEEGPLTGALPQLARPFTRAAIRFKPQTVVDGRSGGKVGLVTYYIDARLAAARLDAVIGAGGWTTEFVVVSADPKLGLPIECRLTVLGATKANVGQIAPGNVDDKAWKSAYSDALKRAGVMFGIGAYLYGGPQVWAEVKVGTNGKAQGFTEAGANAARDAYSKWIASKAMVDLWGEPLDHGDVEHTPIGAEEIAEEQTEAAATAPETPKFTLETALTCLSTFGSDPKPWVKEAVVAYYPAIDAFPARFGDLELGLRVDIIKRLAAVCAHLEKAEADGFNPQANREATQELVSAAFAVGFDGLEVKGPDDYELPLPF